ncbi:MAG: hypothetical protein OHK0013_33200 [Sandaracinaceae bacterium]
MRARVSLAALRALVPLTLVIPPLSPLLVVGCDGNAPPVDPRCGMAGIPVDQPAIACPAEVDLGCIPASGAPLAIAPSASSCDGSPVEVRCDPAMGANVTADRASGTCTATSASGATARCSFRIRARVDGAPRLACETEARAECEGATTTVELPAPSAFSSCGGGELGAVTNDAPASGFARGSTTVTFTANDTSGARASCVTQVVVEDTTPPMVRCPESATVIRRSATDPVTLGAVTATDRCDADVAVRLEPSAPARGTTTMTAIATDDAGLAARCTFEATVLDLFAPTGLRVVSATRTAAGATDATLGWTPSAGADVTRVRLERAPDPDGPWTRIAELEPTTITLTDRAMPGPIAYYRAVALGPAGEEGGATEPLRVFSIDTGGYDLATQAVPGVPFPTTLWATVRAPTALDRGPYPLVLFLHGNHGNCRPASGDDDCQTRTEDACTEPGFTTTPNAAGYVYLQDTLAAQGYVTASLSANALNCRDDFIRERTALLLEHLRRWQRWATTDEPPFSGRFRGAIDLAHVALVGHSRGGEAVSQAPQALAASPIAGVTLSSVLAIGPTDYHENTPRGVPYLVLLPACDADVNDLQGLRMYDRGLSGSDPFTRAQLLFVGTNHNFFNTEWRVDDNSYRPVCRSSDRISASAQRAGLELLLSDWVAITTAGEAPPAYVRTDEAAPPLFERWAGAPLDLRFAYAAARRATVDDFTRAGFATNALGEGNAFSGFTAALACTGTCASNYPHLRAAARIAWDAASASGRFGLGSYDASGYDAMAVRFASRIATINDGLDEHAFLLRVRDAAGTSAEVRIDEVGRLPHRYPAGRPLEILTTVRVPFARLRAVAPALDLARLSSFEVAMPVPDQSRGSIWIADVELHDDP